MLLLLFQLFFMEISAEDAAETIYRMKGQSVCLDPGGQPPFEQAKWTLEKKNIVSVNNINPDFEKKINYKPNSTLCIKKLSLNDTGSYTFSHEINFTNFHKTHQLIVQVPKPALSVVMEANTSLDVCTFTVNCSVRYHHELLSLQSECDNKACRFVNKSFPQINITISSDNGSFTCTSNNHVSSEEESRKIVEVCFSPGPEETTSPSMSMDLIWIVIAICSVTVGGLFILFCFGAKIILTRRKQQPLVIQSQPLEEPSQPRTSSTSTSSTQANSYENVDSENSIETSDHERENDKTRTVYCVLEPRPTTGAPRDPLEETHVVYSVIKIPQI